MTACGNISFTLSKIYGEEQCKWELAVWSFEPKKPTEEWNIRSGWEGDIWDDDFSSMMRRGRLKWMLPFFSTSKNELLPCLRLNTSKRIWWYTWRGGAEKLFFISKAFRPIETCCCHYLYLCFWKSHYLDITRQQICARYSAAPLRYVWLD